MGGQLIFCVETTEKAQTDVIYIKEVRDKYYKDTNQITINYVYMDSKNRYNNKNVTGKINRLIKDYAGKSHVFLCIDTDKFDSEAADRKMFETISNYANDKQYELIWFCHDVEEVFIGSSVHNSDKIKAAAKFRSNNGIKKVEESKLKALKPNVHKSNILRVLDKYLERK